MLQHGHLQCPITALGIAAELLFTGEGPSLRIFHIPTNSLVHHERIFRSHAIHGVAIRHLGNSDYCLLAWAGPFVRPLWVSGLHPGGATGFFSPTICTGKAVRCSDWILHVSWKTHDDRSGEGAQAAAVTAHNALVGLLWERPEITGAQGKIENDTKPRLTLTHLSASTRCLLYTATLKWVSPVHILVAAGTAFGEMIIWSYRMHQAPNLELEDIIVHYAFAAHDGSIFGVDTFTMSSALAPGTPTCIAATCSDDRTIRVWDISRSVDDIAQPGTALCASTSEVNRIPLPAMPWGRAATYVSNEYTATMIARTWAHTSRIWNIGFYQGTEHDGVSLLSHGEDATCQLWRLDFLPSNGAAATTAAIRSLSRVAAHSGKNIWAMAASASQQGLLVATGGADSRVATAQFPSGILASSHSSAAPYANEASRQKTRPDDNTDAGRFKSYSFLGRDILLLTTRSGSVIRAQINPRETEQAKSCLPLLEQVQIAHEPLLANYSIVTACADLGVGFVSSSGGDIFCYQDKHACFQRVLRVPGKVAGITLQSSPSHLYLLTSVINRSEATLAIASLQQDALTEKSFVTTSLQLDPGFVVTSMLLVESGTSLSLFLGSRTGKITLHLLAGENAEKTTHVKTVVGWHEDAVTSMLWSAPAASGAPGYLLSTARDSRYSMHCVSRGSNDCQSSLVHSSALPFGPNVEGCYLRKGDDHLILYGFRSTEFVVYDESTQTEIASIECGGAHRVWAFQESSDVHANGGTFVWTKASALDARRYADSAFHILKRGGHGREIKTCAVRPKRTENEPTIIATGAEDTDIRIFEACDHASDHCIDGLRCLMVAKKHTAGLQQVSWSADGRYLFSCGGAEEFCVWRTRQLPFVDFGMVCESTFPHVSELPDLRIMAFTVERCTPPGVASFSTTITMVFSDSTVRTYHYHSRSPCGQWVLLHVGSYTRCCLMQVVSPVPKELQSLSLLTAASDGNVSLWTNGAGQEFRKLADRRVHQNSIKHMMLLPSDVGSAKKRSQLLLVTVGDDNALVISIFSKSPADLHDGFETSSLSVPSAHAAAINAMVLVKTFADSRWLIATSGNDQKVKLWDVAFHDAKTGVDAIELSLRCSLPTAIADVAAMDVVSHASGAKEIVVCGVGIELFQLTTSHSQST